MDAARQIRQRISWIILRAFLAVLLVTLLAVVLTTAIALSNNANNFPFEQLPAVSRAEGYYLGNGSWVGVEAVFIDDALAPAMTLLDANRRILIDHGAVDGPAVGSLYPSTAQGILVDLTVRGEPVGFLVFDRSAMPSQNGAILRILAPIILISSFLALLATVLMGLLSRRVITPLADVIAASREVAAGKLDARVTVRGPQDLRIMADSFNQMAASLERNEQVRRNLLTDIAHELRTPISAIRGRLEGMLDGVYPADEKHISLALQSSYLLGSLVDDLRLLTLAEAGQLTFDRKELNLASLAEQVIELFSAEAAEKSIALTLQPASGNFLALADPQRVEQVVGNLISNALRYIPEGGEIRLSLSHDANMIRLSVQDNGPGVPEEDLPYIFDRFWRKDKSRARSSGGSGLGLTIARQLIESQGGTIRAENRPEGGLAMVISLPSAGPGS
ncbi:MAG TPA: ATP-binding protein [Anaerolineaceae bacterium]|nr:ATP-binding protein [Anaerolineaceae bacterium]